MSIAASNLPLSRAVRTTDPEAICFFGPWGTGKTYAWEKALNGVPATELGFKRYSYVSLFGINNLGDLKKEIFFKTVDLNDAQTASSDHIVRAGKKISEVLSRLPEISKYSEVALPLLVGSIQQQIVCLDDIERRGDGLSLRDILGLVSFLRDHKQCKIIVILNRNALRPEDRDELDRLIEKTFDFEIRHEPDASECAAIALPGEGAAVASLRSHCISLGICNIRVLRRIGRVAALILSALEGTSEAVRRQAIHGTPLFCWSRFEPDLAPTRDFIRARSHFSERSSDSSPAERAWGALLDRYSFNACDEFDACLLDCIHDGSYGGSELLAEARKLEHQLQQTTAREAQERVWALYHDTFADNEIELASGFAEVVAAHAPHITPTNLNGMVRLLKRIDYPQVATTIIAEYVKQNAENAKTLDLHSYTFRREVTDPDVIAALGAAFSKIDNRQLLERIVKRLADGVIHNKDLVILSKMQPEEYVDIFEKCSDKLSTTIETILQYPGDDEASAEMKQSARAALSTLAQRSKLNAARIEQLGLDISSDTSRQLP